ncbi:MAG: hypothetical protein JNL98_17085 [Bryobacterales bacterium]|nr:hypothetical protein [Bryobacterales bacterium]
MSGSHRRLPHYYREGKWLFVTWRLHGSLPSGQFPPPEKVTSGEAFAAIGRFLDKAVRGPLYLRQPEIAKIVIDAIFQGVTLGHYELAAFVLIANHVHVLLFPKVSPSRLLQRGHRTAGESHLTANG